MTVHPNLNRIYRLCQRLWFVMNQRKILVVDWSTNYVWFDYGDIHSDLDRFSASISSYVDYPWRRCENGRNIPVASLHLNVDFRHQNLVPVNHTLWLDGKHGRFGNSNINFSLVWLHKLMIGYGQPRQIVTFNIFLAHFGQSQDCETHRAKHFQNVQPNCFLSRSRNDRHRSRPVL